MRNSRKAKLLFPILCLIATVSLVYFCKDVFAEDVSWVSGPDPVVAEQYQIDSDYDETNNCTLTQAKIADTSTLQDGCMVSTSTFRFFRSNTDALYVGFGSDTQSYKMTGAPPGRVKMLPDGSTLMVMDGTESGLLIDQNVQNSFKKSVDPTTLQLFYDYHPSYEFILRNKIGAPWQVGNIMGSSDSGRWLVVSIKNVGLVRVNMQTFELKRFSLIGSGIGSNKFKIDGNVKISNDGRYVVAGNSNIPFSITEITDECGEIFNEDSDIYHMEYKACPTRSLEMYPHNPTLSLDAFHFSDDMSELRYRLTSNIAAGGLESWVTLRLPGHESKTLDYLALGDSYSSGEGDTEINSATGKKYYLPYTDIEGDAKRGIPREKCHVSTRSYPFLLKADEGLSDELMKSVACSGAQEKDVQMGLGEESYLGQLTDHNEARLTNLPNIAQLKNDALTNFIPGRIQQVEFVKKYKPKAITFTMGGNNVDFGGKLRECVTSIYTCRYASTNEGRAELGYEIRNLYNSLRALYQEIKSASPNTRVYALGYPQFISDSSICLAPNVWLDKGERIMIHEGVSYINEVIKAAAAYEGIKYIDIENAFQGHLLCSINSSIFVTGISFIRSNELQESFHPNNLGHKAMFDNIQSSLEGKSLNTYSYCAYQKISCPDKSISEPLPTPYFLNAMDEVNKNSEMNQFVSKK